MWLTISLEASAHVPQTCPTEMLERCLWSQVQILSVLAQELHSHGLGHVTMKLVEIGGCHKQKFWDSDGFCASAHPTTSGIRVERQH